MNRGAVSISVQIAHKHLLEGLVLGIRGIPPVTAQDSLVIHVPMFFVLVPSSLGLRLSLGGLLDGLWWNDGNATAPEGGVATAIDCWFSLLDALTLECSRAWGLLLRFGGKVRFP